MTLRRLSHSAPGRAIQLAACYLILAAPAAAQTPAVDYLANGIARVQAGDFQLGVMMLNEVVAPESKADSRSIARAHAYRAQAFLGLNQPGNARAAALLALKADPNLSVAAPPYSAPVVALFQEVRRPAAAASPEIAAAVATQTGTREEAFTAYVAAYQALPPSAPAADEQRLREKVIAAARSLGQPPAIPSDARAQFAKADQLLAAQSVLGGGRTASLEAAAAELQSAIRSAPWWAEATLRLARVLQELQRVDAALMNLELYRRADPEGYARITATSAEPEKPAARAEVPRTASVQIYWPKQGRGGGPKKIYCDGSLIAELRNGHFVALNVLGGSHNFKVTSKSETFAIEAGKSYYVRASVEGFPALFKLRLVDAAEATAELRDTAATVNDPAHTYATTCSVTPSPGR